MDPVIVDVHPSFGQCVAGRYQVFGTLRQERVFALSKAFDLVEQQAVQVVSLPGILLRGHPRGFAGFREFAARLRSLESPLLVVPLGEAGREGDALFWVEPCPRGKSLAAVLRERRETGHPFPAAEIVGLGLLLCRAVEALGPVTIHGFLHPREVYLEPWPGGPLPFYPRVAHPAVRVLLRAAGLALEGLPESTACYAAPEFMAEGPLERRVDVYGIGAILYALATLRLPTGRFVRPSRVHGEIPRAFDDLLLRAMDEEPEGRFESARALGEALEGLGLVPGDRRRRLGAVPGGPSAEETKGRDSSRGRKEPKRREKGETREGGVAGGRRCSPPSAARAYGAGSFCLVLLLLLSIGLFCLAALEALPGGRGGPYGAEAFEKWEAFFSGPGARSAEGRVAGGERSWVRTGR